MGSIDQASKSLEGKKKLFFPPEALSKYFLLQNSTLSEGESRK